jgi:hypothetical protein
MRWQWANAVRHSSGNGNGRRDGVTKTTLKLGDLEIEMEKQSNGRNRIAVYIPGSGLPGVATEASDDAVRDAARDFIKFIEEGE